MLKLDEAPARTIAAPAVLHGTWLPAEGRLFLWGELSERAARRGRHRRRPGHPPHPAQAHTDALHERLAALPSSSRVPPAAERTIWLPSVMGAPLPLRELRQAGAENPRRRAGPGPLARARPPAQPRPVPRPAAAPGSDHGLGADLRAWRSAAMLAVELVAGQQILPALTRDSGGLRASWDPRPVPDVARKIAALRGGMPALCRAVVDAPEAAPAPRALVDSFLAAAVDALVRQIAAGNSAAATQLAAWRSLPPSPGAAWMVALLDRDPTLRLRSREADELFRAWQAWAGQEHVAGDESFRITFRLQPPAEASEQWTLSYMLQAIDDPSLLVPAAQLWRERGQHFTYLDRRFAHPQERLLRGLGFAARLVPAIERSLRGKAPDHASLGLEEAFSFLKEAAPLLEQSGFGVLVPSWWGNSGRLKARAKAAPRKMKRSDGPGRLSFQSMIDFRWELSVGDQPINREEFERLVELKQPLVQVRGEWVVLDPDQARKAMDLFSKGGQVSMAQLLRMGLGGLADDLPAGLSFGGVDAEGDLGDLLRALSNTASLEQLPQPEGFVGALRPYQLRGLSWLAFLRRFGLGACLADDMGLGKTIAGDRPAPARPARSPPPAARPCWSARPRWWATGSASWPASRPPCASTLHHGAERHRGDELRAGGRRARRGDHHLRPARTATARPWTAAGLAHGRARRGPEHQEPATPSRPRRRGPPGRWPHRAHRHAGREPPVGAVVHHGLPQPRLPRRRRRSFRRSFARPIERAGDAEAAARLRGLAAPFILRRLKTDRSIIDDLPEKMEMKVFCTLTQEQATLYEAVVRDALSEIEGADDEGAKASAAAWCWPCSPGSSRSATTRPSSSSDGSRPRRPLRQAGPPRRDARGGARRRRPGADLHPVRRDGRAAPGATWHERLGAEVLFLHGGTPGQVTRRAWCERFQAPEGPPIFILSLKAGGVGLNLTRANHVFHFDRWWNPAVENQATDRAFRIGQTRNVQVHKFVCGGTLEEKIDEMIEGKSALAAQVLGAGEAWLTELSTDQLRDLVALRRDAAE